MNGSDAVLLSGGKVNLAKVPARYLVHLFNIDPAGAPCQWLG